MLITTSILCRMILGLSNLAVGYTQVEGEFHDALPSSAKENNL